MLNKASCKRFKFQFATYAFRLRWLFAYFTFLKVRTEEMALSSYKNYSNNIAHVNSRKFIKRMIVYWVLLSNSKNRSITPDKILLLLELYPGLQGDL